MKRINFFNGVVSLSFIILSSFVFYIFGYLDELSYYHITHENSFYGETTVPVRAYRIYRFYLFCVLVTVFCYIFTLIADSNAIYKRVSRLQIGCYRPHLIYHTMVCLIPFVVRYVDMNGEIQDDVMLHMQWKHLYNVISSVIYFIYVFFVSVARRYKLWRLILYVFTTIVHAIIVFIILCNFLSSCLYLLETIKESKGNFFTTWSYNDNKHFPATCNDLSISKMNKIYNYLYLDEELFRNTGEKVYQSRIQELKQYTDKKGQTPPYHREVFSRSLGESVSLSCTWSVLFNTTNSSSISGFWTVRERNVTSVSRQSIITTDFKRDRDNWINANSTLTIDEIKKSEFGNYSCSFHTEGSTESYNFQDNILSDVILDVEYLIGQYRIKQYKGEIFFVYASPGNVVELKWRPMFFNSELRDLVQYYYINGILHSGENDTCSAFSYLYFLYGKAMDWFFVPDFPSPSHFLLYDHGSYETNFLQCAGPRFFGVHRIEYFRPIFNTNTRSSTLIEVKHPDTLIVLPDQPYFLKMDNTTKADKERIIRKIQQFNMEYTWFENTHKGILTVRLIVEVLILVFAFLFLDCVFRKMWNLYTQFVIKPIRNISLGSPILDKSDSNRVEYIKEYSCYVVSCDSDKEIVYNSLVLPLREKNITTGFIFEECNINKSGKSEFDIQSDIIKKCENLIFFVTSSYLQEEAFLGIHLDTVLKCIQMESMSPNSVLVIFSDSCELPDKLRYNLPEAVIHDWLKSTDHKERLDLILRWIKKKEARTSQDVVVSTIFLG